MRSASECRGGLLIVQAPDTDWKDGRTPSELADLMGVKAELSRSRGASECRGSLLIVGAPENDWKDGRAPSEFADLIAAKTKLQILQSVYAYSPNPVCRSGRQVASPHVPKFKKNKP